MFCSNHKIEGYVARRTTSSAKAEHLQKVKRRGVKDPLATQPGDQDPLATAAGAFPRLEKRDIWNYARCRCDFFSMRADDFGAAWNSKS